MDEKYYNIGDLVRFSEYGHYVRGHLVKMTGCSANVTSLGLIVSDLKENIGGLSGYKVKFPNLEPLFFALTEIELVKAMN